MDVFLVKNGIIENVVMVPSMEWAIAAYPDFAIIERTSGNATMQIGDPCSI